ncbi:MAG: hypothetical protein ACTTK5_01450 [Candidatus Fimenecus sp.]
MGSSVFLADDVEYLKILDGEDNVVVFLDNSDDTDTPTTTTGDYAVVAKFKTD